MQKKCNMLVNVLKSKIHRVTVTEANLDYIGSITIDEELMVAANIIENEQVDIYNITNGERFHTYVIKGEPGSGIIGINGAGKTTLLRMLNGQLPHDGGDFFVSSDLRLGYLEQDGGFDSENTVIEEVNKVFEHFPEMEKEMERLLEEQSLAYKR